MLEQGQVLNDTYRIVRLIGEGGMGSVYEAAHSRLAGRYAVKVLLSSLSGDANALAHFDREARITSSLQHPNIVQIVDFNRDTDGGQYLVMEYLQGETLANRLARRGPLPPSEVADIVDQIAAALSAAHAHGVVHRDLKPDNVILVPVEGRLDEVVKILDFGISKMRDLSHRPDGPISAALMGTPQYMAPEQCQGRTADVDGASDQFALAAITYEMLSGHAAFTGENLGIVLTRVLHQQAPRIGVDPAVEQVVQRGLEKQKAARFASVAAFANAFRAAAVPVAVLPSIGNDVHRPHVPPQFDLGVVPERATSRAAGTARVSRGSSRGWRQWTMAAVVVGSVGGIAAFFVANRLPAQWRMEYNAVGAVPPKGTDTGVSQIASAPAAAPPKDQTTAAAGSRGEALVTPEAPVVSGDGRAKQRSNQDDRPARRTAKRHRAPETDTEKAVPASARAPLPDMDGDATMPINEDFGEPPAPKR